MPSIQHIIDEKQFALECVQDVSHDGEPFYAYVVLKKTMLTEFRKALAERDVDLSEFGVVVATGVGAEIPEGLDEQVMASIQKQGT